MIDKLVEVVIDTVIEHIEIHDICDECSSNATVRIKEEDLLKTKIRKMIKSG